MATDGHSWPRTVVLRNFNPEQPIEVSLGSVYGSVPGGPSVNIAAMGVVPEADEWRDMDLCVGKFATPVLMLLDVDTDGTDEFHVGIHFDEGHHRLELIDKAIEALTLARQTLEQARHVEWTDRPWRDDVVAVKKAEFETDLAHDRERMRAVVVSDSEGAGASRTHPSVSAPTAVRSAVGACQPP